MYWVGHFNNWMRSSRKTYQLGLRPDEDVPNKTSRPDSLNNFLLVPWLPLASSSRGKKTTTWGGRRLILATSPTPQSDKRENGIPATRNEFSLLSLWNTHATKHKFHLQAPPNAHQLILRELVWIPGKGPVCWEILVWMMDYGEQVALRSIQPAWRLGALRREPMPKPPPKGHFKSLASAGRAGPSIHIWKHPSMGVTVNFPTVARLEGIQKSPGFGICLYLML